MCNVTILFDTLVSGETMHSDNPAGLFYIDMIQKLMKGEYMVHLHHKTMEGGSGEEKRGTLLPLIHFSCDV